MPFLKSVAMKGLEKAKQSCVEILKSVQRKPLYTEFARILSINGWVADSIRQLQDRVKDILKKALQFADDALQFADDALPYVATAFAAVEIIPNAYDGLEYPCGCCTVPDKNAAKEVLGLGSESAGPPSAESLRMASESEQIAAYMAQQKQLSTYANLTALKDQLSLSTSTSADLTNTTLICCLLALSVLSVMLVMLCHGSRRAALIAREMSLHSPLIG